MPSDDALNFFTWKDMLCQKWKIAARRAHWVLDRLHQLSRLNSLLVIETWWFSTAPLVMWLLLEHREPQSLVSFKSLQSRQMCKKRLPPIYIPVRQQTAIRVEKLFLNRSSSVVSWHGYFEIEAETKTSFTQCIRNLHVVFVKLQWTNCPT